MEEIVNLIMNYGVSTVIIALFVVDWFTNKKKINETLSQNAVCLQEIKSTNANTSKSLELLQESMNTQKDFLFQHDKRCENIEKDISEINKNLATK